MRKLGNTTLIIALALWLLAVILVVVPGVGPGALDPEKVFMAQLHNSLYYIDIAKRDWAEEKHKSERDVPTLADLTPYLGDWTNRIERLIALGIDYKITPAMENQSDIATLTRDLGFRRGISRFYPAGKRYCIHTGWTHGNYVRPFRAFYINNRELLAAVLFISGIGTLIAFVVRKIRNLRQAGCVAHENQNPMSNRYRERS